MFNIAAAGNLGELGRRIRRARTKLHWSQEAFAGVCGLERSYYGGVERGKRNVTFKVLCLSCDGLACDVATITQGLPHGSGAIPRKCMFLPTNGFLGFMPPRLRTKSRERLRFFWASDLM